MRALCSSTFLAVAWVFVNGCHREPSVASQEAPPSPVSQLVAAGDASAAAAHTSHTAPPEAEDSRPVPATAPPPGWVPDAAVEKRGEASVASQSELEAYYLGVHKVGVNRVGDSRRTGRAEIVREGNALVLRASLVKPPFRMELSGRVIPESRKKFVVEGELSGVPDMRWAGEDPTPRSTRGRFTFEATKGRKYWRLYEVDDQECVCQEQCGNDFCYIDIDF